MEAKLYVIDHDTSEEFTFEYDNLTIDMFTPVKEVDDPAYPNIVLREPGGKAMTLITSNMPQGLKDELTPIIKKYYNH